MSEREIGHERERRGENLRSKSGTGYMRRIFFINCSGTPYCVTLYVPCTTMRVLLWMYYCVWLHARNVYLLQKSFTVFILELYWLPVISWIFVLRFAHFSLLPSDDLVTKWLPINMWEWLCSLGVVVRQPTERFFHSTSLWFSVFALSTRVKHQRQGLTILTLNRSLCLFLASGFTL